MKKFILISIAFLLASCGDGFPAQSEVDSHDADDIVGGQEIQRGDVRNFFVAKLLVGNGPSTSYCTATHISDTVLITAAHCFTSKNVRQMRLVYRTHSWAGESRLIKKVIEHSDYPKDVKSDLALIQIYGLKPNTQRVLSLNFEKPDQDIFNILSIGYGITNTKRTGDNDGKGLGILRAVETKVISYSMKGDDFSISMKSGKGINSGDSGGPGIYFKDGEPTILGIARSVDYHIKGRTRIFDSFGYYTALGYHKPWVLKTLRTLENSN